MPNFTDQEIQDMKDNLSINLNNGTIEVNGRVIPRHDQYSFSISSDTKNAPINEVFDITDECGHRIWLKPDDPETFDLDFPLQAYLDLFIDRPVGEVLETVFGEVLVTKITTTRTVTNAVSGQETIPSNTFNLVGADANFEEVDLEDLQFKIKDSVLDIKDWLNLMLFLNIEKLEKHEDQTTLLCNFNNMVDPNGDFLRELQISISLKDKLKAEVSVEKRNLENDEVQRYHRNYISYNILDTTKLNTTVKASIPQPTLPADYSNSEEYLDILAIPNASLRRSKLRKYTINYVKNNLEEILADNRVDWDQFWNRFNSTRITPKDPAKFPDLIKNKVLIEANKLQNILNTVVSNWDIRTKCDNNNKPCNYTGYAYKILGVDVDYAIYMSSMSISYVSTDTNDQHTITIFFTPGRMVFEDSEGRDMLFPYNAIDQSSSGANTYSDGDWHYDDEGKRIAWDSIGGRSGAKDWVYRSKDDVRIIVPQKKYTPKIILDPDDPEKKLIKEL